MTKLYMVFTDDWNQDYYGTFTSKQKANDMIDKVKKEDNLLRYYDFWIRETILDEWEDD